jgi:hypothetical protein
VTDISADEAIEEILGTPIYPSEDMPAAVNPCWEEKHGSTVTGYDPDEDDPLPVLLDIRDQLARLETAINQVGTQTNWLVTAFAEARAGFMTMSSELAKAGPMGLIKMLTSNKKKGAETDG